MINKANYSIVKNAKRTGENVTFKMRTAIGDIDATAVPTYNGIPEIVFEDSSQMDKLMHYLRARRQEWIFDSTKDAALSQIRREHPGLFC